MNFQKTLVSVLGLGLIVFIYWFFFGKKEEEVLAGKNIEILVDGGYKPSTIKIKKGQKTVISLLRKDKNTCLEEFILPDFKIKKYLPLGKAIEIEITPAQSGVYLFHCGMNMFHGKVVVD